MFENMKRFFILCVCVCVAQNLYVQTIFFSGNFKVCLLQGILSSLKVHMKRG